jgi:hypothetical protein
MLKKEKRDLLIEKAPFIEIRLKSGNAVPLNEVIKINAMGLIKSKREGN